MDTHEGPDTRNRLSMRRFTTLEGWREVRSGLYLVAGSTISTIIANRTYDPEWQLQDDRGAQPALRPLGLEAIGQPVNIGLGRNQQLAPAKRLSNTTEDLSDCSTQRSSISLEEKENLPATEAKVACSGYLERPLPATPFHSFTNKEKWLVIVTVGVAGLFSGLSSNIYFPALDTIAKDLRVSPTAVSLTITSYLVIQGISPLIWGPLSDIVGRRPIYICSFSVYIAANIVLALSPNFPVLLVFRGLQSAGSASTVSIGNGVIQDIATPIERGAFIGFYQAIRNFSIAIGPVIGGLLAQYFGFRSIFLFLVTMSSIVLGVIIVFLPETLRSVAGDGSWSMSGIYQPLVGRWKTKDRQKRMSQTPISRPRVTVMSFLGPLKLLTEKDILANLIFGGTVYTVWSMVVASTTELFKQRFGLGDLTLGLIFLPNGFGTILGSMIAGKLMTRDFLNFEKDYLARNPLAPPPSKNTKDLPLDFPIEHARLRNTPYITAIFVLATGIYGITILPAEQLPVILKSGWIAVPLVLQFVIAAASNAIFAINTALVADLCPGKGASSTAINNLVRCSMGALGVAVVDSMIGSFGTAATFLGLGLTTTAMTSLLAAEWAWGMRWRSERVQVETAMAQHSAGGA